MKICFDMDGTIADLYGVENWLDYLIAKDPTPYKEAKPLIRMATLARLLNSLQKLGVEIEIISWLSKESTPEYDEMVTATKEKWLATHLKSVKWDAIHIVSYGFEKNTFCESEYDILFDDEAGNRNAWTGRAYDVNNIPGVLREIAKAKRQEVKDKEFEENMKKLLEYLK